MRGTLLLLLVAVLMAGCRSAGTAPQELEQLRVRVSVLEAENAHLLGQASITESERDKLRQQVEALSASLARAEVGGGQVTDGVVAGSDHLVVVPREVRPGEWLAIHIRNYPLRLLPHAGVALRAGDGTNLSHVGQLAAANLFLLPVPQTVSSGTYRVVIGEVGPLGPGAKIDDEVSIIVHGR